jgi:hypothetical protein
MKPLFQEPVAKEDKPLFATVPPPVKAALEELVGSRILSARTAYGGFSAAAGFVVETDGNQKFFVKGGSPGDTSHGTQNLRQDIAAYAVPAVREAAARHLGVVGDGNEDGWLLGVWEHIDTQAAPVEKMIGALAAFQSDKAEALKPALAQNYISLFLDPHRKWLRPRDDGAARGGFLSLFSSPADEWFAGNIQKLCALQTGASWKDDGLLHGDLRADNFLYDGRRTFVIDWPNACRGPRAFDRLFLRANLAALGYGPMAALPEAATLPRDEEVSMAVCLSGFFADQVYRAVPEKLPRLRWMQKGIFLALLLHLSTLGVIEPPPPMKGQNP